MIFGGTSTRASTRVDRLVRTIGTWPVRAPSLTSAFEGAPSSSKKATADDRDQLFAALSYHNLLCPSRWLKFETIDTIAITMAPPACKLKRFPSFKVPLHNSLPRWSRVPPQLLRATRRPHTHLHDSAVSALQQPASLHRRFFVPEFMMVSSKLPSKKTNSHVDHLAIPPALPPSVEEAYRRKCLQLKQRTKEVEDTNNAARVRLARLRRGVEKLRLERAFLLEQLAKRTSTNVEDSEGSPSPPPTVRVDDHQNNTTNGPLSPNTTTSSSLPIRHQAAARRHHIKTKHQQITGTDHDLPLQPQDKPLRSKRGHRKPSVVATGLDSNGPPPTFVNQNTHNLSPSSDAFSHSVAADPKGANGVNKSVTVKKPATAFEIYCKEHREAATSSKEEGVTVDEELARRWKELSESQQDEYKAREKAEGEPKAEKAAETAEAATEAEGTPARDEDVEMENDD